MRKRRRIEQSRVDEKSHNDQESSDASISKPTTTTYSPAESLSDVRKKHRQDMYKVMDGSALMALGSFISYFLWNPLIVESLQACCYRNM